VAYGIGKNLVGVIKFSGFFVVVLAHKLKALKLDLKK
jgi:hypothetical protein